MKPPRLTQPQLRLLREIVIKGLAGTHIYGTSTVRVANTLYRYELITLHDDGGLALPTNKGLEVAENGGQL